MRKKKATSKKAATKAADQKPNPLVELDQERVARLAGCEPDQVHAWKEYPDKLVVIVCTETKTHRRVIEKTSK